MYSREHSGADLIRLLAQWQVDIYWAHDGRRFLELADNASKLFSTLGQTGPQAEKVRHLISQAYQHADLAEAAAHAKNFDEEMKWYKSAAAALSDAAEVLNVPKGTARVQVRWWYHVRHGNKPMAVFWILAQHIRSYRPHRLWVALELTFYLVQIGLAHEKKNKRNAVLGAKKYWKTLLREEDDVWVPYLG